MSAASGENPDSFEISQFIVEASGGSGSNAPPPPPPSHQDRDTSGQNQDWSDEVPDAPASNYKDDTAQFEDLHNRLQVLQHHLHTLVVEVDKIKVQQEEKHTLLVNRYLAPMHDFQDQIHRQIKDIESKVNALDSAEFKQAVKEMHDALSKNHESIMYQLPSCKLFPTSSISFTVVHVGKRLQSLTYEQWEVTRVPE